MKRIGFAIFYCYGALQLALAQPANAQSTNTYYVTLYKYFSLVPAFPILIPQGEQAGDVYSRPGVIFDRKEKCFKEAGIDSSDTYFPRSIILDASNVDAQVALKRSHIARAAADAGVYLSDSVVVSYGTAGKGKWDQIVESKLVSILESDSDNNTCRSSLLRKLRSTPDGLASVPLIIQSVWYATVNISYQTRNAISAKAKAAIETELSPLIASGNVSTDQKSDSLLIADTGSTEYPVAWRPAFISSDHYHYIDGLTEERGWFRALQEKIGLTLSDREILEILQKDFKLNPKEVPTPKDIAEDMSRGKAISFEPNNEKHLAYIRAVNALFGLSLAIYSRSRT